MSEIIRYYANIPNTVPKYSVLNYMLKRLFRLNSFKTNTQRKAISKIMKRESDVIITMPTSYGRSTCFQLPILICMHKVSIVIVPILSKIKMQVKRLRQKKIYAEILSTNTTAEERERIRRKLNLACYLFSSNNVILYVTLDQVSNDSFLGLLHNLVQNNNIGFIVFDESNCEDAWKLGEENQSQALSMLRNAYKHIPWIISTTKSNTEAINCIKTELCLRTLKSDLPMASIPCFGLNLFYDRVKRQPRSTIKRKKFIRKGRK